MHTIQKPINCPVCDDFLIQDNVYLICPNPSCPAQMEQKIIHFVSKDCMDIEWLGESIIKILISKNIIKNITDIYDILDINIQSEISNISWFGSKKIENIVSSLQKSKKNSLWRILNSLSIPHIWKKMAKILEQEIMKDFETNQKTTTQKIEHIITKLSDKLFLENIHWIWSKSIEHIAIFVKNHKQIFEKLINYGFEFDNFEMLYKEEKSNIHFCITWTFDTPRPKIIELFEKNWFVSDNNITNQTKFLIAWANAWSKKQKAIQKNIKIYDNISELQNDFDFVWNLV